MAFTWDGGGESFCSVVFTATICAAGEADTGLIWASPDLFFWGSSPSFLFPSGAKPRPDGKKSVENVEVTRFASVRSTLPLPVAGSSGELAPLPMLFPTKTNLFARGCGQT